MCGFQDSVLTTIRPRNLVYELLEILLLSKHTHLCQWLAIFCLKMYVVSFFYVNERPVFLNMFTFPKTVSIFTRNSIKLQCVQSMLVSLANKTGIVFLFMTAGKSFMYERNSVGPNTETCHTPFLILA
jgi:hypothetical protein